MKYPFLESLNLDRDAINYISRSLDRVVVGSDNVIITPIGKRHDPEKLFSKWDRIVEANKHLLNDVLYKIEGEQRLKRGPRSIAVPWVERRSSVQEYFRKDIPNGADDLQKGVVLGHRLRPLTAEQAIKELKNNTNSGLPFLQRKGVVKNELIGRLDEFLDREDPCVLFTRTQESRKTRNVWGYPIADSAQEYRFYSPLLTIQKNLSWRSALRGPDHVDESITNLFRGKKDSEKLVSIDFSKYDTSVRGRLQKAAFSYIKGMYQKRYHAELDQIAYRFANIGLITPDGVLTGPHGVPSGSTFTNEVDSIAQFLIASDFGLKPDCFDIQGDDAVYKIDSQDQVDKFIATLRSYGLEISKEKSVVSSKHCTYLQKLYHPDYMVNGKIGGIYPTYRALNRILYQERFDVFADKIVGSDYYSLRTISILENCKHHPLFEKLVKFVYSYDLHKLSYGVNGIENYVKMALDSSGTAGVLLNQYGDELTGIGRFETIKYLRSL